MKYMQIFIEHFKKLYQGALSPEDLQLFDTTRTNAYQKYHYEYVGQMLQEAQAKALNDGGNLYV
jgi:hypothetical protein